MIDNKFWQLEKEADGPSKCVDQGSIAVKEGFYIRQNHKKMPLNGVEQYRAEYKKCQVEHCTKCVGERVKGEGGKIADKFDYC